MVWKSDKDGNHFNNDKKRRDTGSSGTEVNIEIDNNSEEFSEGVRMESMNQPAYTDDNAFVAKQIFKELELSRVNGFPFFAYTGVKPSIFSAESLYLKLPKNPSEFKSILILYDYVRDTYKVQFYTDDEPLRKEDIYPDIYVGHLADLIVEKMGVG